MGGKLTLATSSYETCVLKARELAKMVVELKPNIPEIESAVIFAKSFFVL